MTKLDMSLFYARHLGITDTDYLMPIREGPKPSEVRRPRDCHLSNSVLETLQIDTAEEETFESWFSRPENL